MRSGCTVGHGVERVAPVGHGVHVEAGVAERGLEHRPQVVLVVDEQQPALGHEPSVAPRACALAVSRLGGLSRGPSPLTVLQRGLRGSPACLRRAWLIAVPVAVLLVAVVGPWLYLNVIRDDPPDRLSLDDVTTTTDGGGDTSSSTTSEAPPRRPRTGSRATGASATGSQAGYRVKEVLFGQDAEAVGRTSDVTGTPGDRGDDGDRGRRRGRHDDGGERRVASRRPVPGPHHGDRHVPDGDVHAHGADRARDDARRRRGGRADGHRRPHRCAA